MSATGMWSHGPAVDPKDVKRIADALERIADCLDDVNHDGQVAVKGLIVTREDRP